MVPGRERERAKERKRRLRGRGVDKGRREKDGDRKKEQDREAQVSVNTGQESLPSLFEVCTLLFLSYQPKDIPVILQPDETVNLSW